MIASALWNVFLAALPVPFGCALARRLRTCGRGGAGWVGVALASAWLLLLPNSPYLLTEIRHLVLGRHFRDLAERAAHDPAALRLTAAWGVLFVAYGALGLLLYVLAVRPVERALRRRGGSLPVLRTALASLAAVGVWLGLVPRLNSWDAVTRPGEVLGAVRWAFTHAAAATSIAGFTLALLVLHTAADLSVDGLRRHVGRRAVAHGQEPTAA